MRHTISMKSASFSEIHSMELSFAPKDIWLLLAACVQSQSLWECCSDGEPWQAELTTKGAGFELYWWGLEIGYQVTRSYLCKRAQIKTLNTMTSRMTSRFSRVNGRAIHSDIIGELCIWFLPGVEPCVPGLWDRSLTEPKSCMLHHHRAYKGKCSPLCKML